MQLRPSPPRFLLAAALGLLIVAGAPGQETSSREIDRGVADLFESTRHGVVGVVARGGRALFNRGGGYGTGLVLDADKRLILTSIEAVPERATEATVRYADHTTSRAEVVARNEALDAVLLVADEMPATVVVLPLGDSSRVAVGTIVVTLGNAYQSIVRVGQVSVSLGVVSGIYEAEGHATTDERVFELDAAVNPGSFGGPVVDLEGRVIGIQNATYAHSRWLGTAVPIDPIKEWIARHESGQPMAEARPDPTEPKPPGGYLGLVLAPGDGGLVVKGFDAGSPAESTDLVPGDVLLMAGSQHLSTVDDWRTYVAGRRPGQQVRLAVLREGKILRVDVILGSKFM